MFEKKKGKKHGPTVVGSGSEIEGTLRAPDGLQVDGTIDGTVIVTGGMSVGPDGLIRKDVHADSAAIAGRVEGTLVVDGHLHLLSTGVLEGDVKYGTLQIDKGGQLGGQAKRIKSAAEAAEEEDEKLERPRELVSVRANA